MASTYIKQRSRLPDNERLKESTVDYLNQNKLPQFLDLLGLDLKPGDPAPESGGVPRLFILDEEKPDEPRTLAEEGAAVGSAKFWELARQGKHFGFAAGEKEPVQIQFTGGMPGSLSLSEPLSPDKDKLASRNADTGIEPPKPAPLPPKAARPGWFARLMHSINSNWYKAEHDNYEKRRQERLRVDAENRTMQEDYEKKVREARAPLNAVCQSVSSGAAKAFAAKRTEAVLEEEVKAKTSTLKRKKAQEAQAEREKAAADAEIEKDRIENSRKNMMSVYGSKPHPLPHLEGKHYKKTSFSQLSPIELPDGLMIGNTKVDDKLFANLALHAQLNPETAKQWDMIVHKQDTLPEMMDNGLSREEAERALIQASGGMLIDIVAKSPRVDTDQFFPCAEQGRLRAKEALEEYQQGKKGKLADIIVASAHYMKDTARNQEHLSGEVTLADAKLTGELMDLLDQDDELSELCEQKGLTQEDVDLCMGADYLRQLEDAKLKAEAKIQKAAAKHEDLEPAEKKECLHAIYKFRTAEARIHSEMLEVPYEKMQEELSELTTRSNATIQVRYTKKPLPEGMKPLSGNAYSHLCIAAKLKHKKPPASLAKFEEYKSEADMAKEVQRQPEPNLLDKLADMTVQSLRLETMSAEKLADKAIGNKGLTLETLLAHQGTLLNAAEKEKRQRSDPQKAKELEQDELNNAVLYDEHGRRL